MDYKQMAKNPIQYLLGVAIVGLGYLHMEQSQNFQAQIDRQDAHIQRQEGQIIALRAENKELQNKYIELAKSIRSN
tara:strand:- start:163 stop:390 length:228 start_codon:yes stop_codon:yes gene_type:complete